MFRPWVTWCLAHRICWVVFAVLLLILPVYLLVGCYHGAIDLARYWRHDWRNIQRAAQGDKP